MEDQISPLVLIIGGFLFGLMAGIAGYMKIRKKNN
ncbi:MAG: LPXTG cell wall anchor domain-containing protein [Pseudomonadota bacterium]